MKNIFGGYINSRTFPRRPSRRHTMVANNSGALITKMKHAKSSKRKAKLNQIVGKSNNNTKRKRNKRKEKLKVSRNRHRAIRGYARATAKKGLR